MPILCCSGSVRDESANLKLLRALDKTFTQYQFTYFDIGELPLFLPVLDQAPWPPKVLAWRAAVAEAEAVICTTPAYLHNLPALVKNALEWLTTSGELAAKPVLPITFTPHPPRGERAMQALLWSLRALDARVVAHLPLYQNEIELKGTSYEFNEDTSLLLAESLQLLTRN